MRSLITSSHLFALRFSQIGGVLSLDLLLLRHLNFHFDHGLFPLAFDSFLLQTVQKRRLGRHEVERGRGQRRVLRQDSNQRHHVAVPEVCKHHCGLGADRRYSF